MKKYGFLLALSFSLSGFVQAQYLKVPIGKKFKVVTQTENTIDATMMDQHQEIRNTSTVFHDLELKAISNTGYTLALTPIRFKMQMNMMGMEQNIDTDSATTMSAPELAAFKELLHQPMVIVMDSNKLISKTAIKQAPAITANLDDPNRFFLLIAPSKLVQGYQWIDSLGNADMQTVNHYTVMNISPTELALDIRTDSRISTVTKMQEMEIKQNLKGYATAKRWYNLSNGLLLKEESTTDMAGTTETAETNSPISLKIKLKLVVEQ